VSRFHVLRLRTHFRRYLGRRVPFSCFAIADSFSAVPRASGPYFMFCAPGVIFGVADCVGSRFNALRSCTRFRRYRGRQLPFQCCVLQESFSAVPNASGPVFMFCPPELVFRRYRERRVPFSCFVLPDSFSSGPVFMFCTPGLIFGDIEGIGSHFHVLCSQTHFRRCRVRQVPFSCFVLPDSFSAVPSASGPILMFSAPGLVSGGNEGVKSRFHVLRSRTCFWRYRGRRVLFSCFVLRESFSTVPRASGPVFMFCTRRLVFDGTKGVGSLFHALRSQTHFRRYQVRRVPFSYLVRPDSFSAILRTSGPIFMFCAPRIIFDGAEGVGSLFHALCSQTHFRRYQLRRVPFSYLVRHDSFSAILRTSGPIFMFCAPRIIFDGAEGVGSLFHALRSQTHFRRYQERRVLFSCFVLPDSFSAVPNASGPVFISCPP
jgi:hypothetical protein